MLKNKNSLFKKNVIYPLLFLGSYIKVSISKNQQNISLIFSFFSFVSCIHFQEFLYWSSEVIRYQWRIPPALTSLFLYRCVFMESFSIFVIYIIKVDGKREWTFRDTLHCLQIQYNFISSYCLNTWTPALKNAHTSFSFRKSFISLSAKIPMQVFDCRFIIVEYLDKVLQ